MTQTTARSVRVLSAIEYANLSVKDADTLYFITDAAYVIINFELNGGTGDTSTTYRYGEALGGLPTPIKTGCTFAGWYTTSALSTAVSASTVVTSTQTFYAKWVAATVKLSFIDDKHNTKVVVNATAGSTMSSYLPSSNPSAITGWEFCGWGTKNVSGDGSVLYSPRLLTTSVVPNTDTTYYALWYPTIIPCNGTIRISGLLSLGYFRFRGDSHEVEIFYNGEWKTVPMPSSFSWGGSTNDMFFLYNRKDYQCLLIRDYTSDTNQKARLYDVSTGTAATADTTVSDLTADMIRTSIASNNLDIEVRTAVSLDKYASIMDDIYEQLGSPTRDGTHYLTVYIPPINAIDQQDQLTPVLSYHKSNTEFRRRFLYSYGEAPDYRIGSGFYPDAFENTLGVVDCFYNSTNAAFELYNINFTDSTEYARKFMKTSA